jgi:plastocyanin
MNTKTTFMFVRKLVAGAVVSLILNCSVDEADEATGRTSSVGGDASVAGEGSPGGSAAGGGSSQAGRSAGGRAGAESAVPLGGQGGDVRAGEGGSGTDVGEGHGGEPAAGTGGQPSKPIYVNGCVAFVDRSNEAASRSIVWNDALIFDPTRCLRVRVGQTVTFDGDHDSHPMVPQGGDTPNPVGPAATFTAPGIFGYECIPHPSEMNGAIEVVP